MSRLPPALPGVVLPSSVAQAWRLTGSVATSLALGLAVFLLFALLARLLRNLASRVMRRRSIRSDAALLATRALYVGIISLGAAMFVGVALGNNIYAVTGILVAAVLTSVGLQDLVKNYVSGFYVLMEKNVRVGDMIESGGYVGVVTDIRMRVTYLRGGHGEMIVVPNGELFSKTVIVSEAPPGWGSGPKGAEDHSDQGVEVGPR